MPVCDIINLNLFRSRTGKGFPPKRMNLAIFDVDGTLTKTVSIDDKCFTQAFAISKGITGIDTDWTKYHYPTDSGITLQIFREKLGREPNSEELRKLKRCFINLLKKRSLSDPQDFTEITGASSLLKCFRKEPGWAIAIAAGGWPEPATLKLQAAGMGINDFPTVFADEGISREEILEKAIKKALIYYRQKNFKKIVSIGDGLWDVRTAIRLSIPFLGIAGGKRAALLRKAGVSHILKDFRDYNRFLHYLNEAQIPKAK